MLKIRCVCRTLIPPGTTNFNIIIINKRPEGPLSLTLVPYNKRVKNLTSEWNQKQEQFIQNALY